MSNETGNNAKNNVIVQGSILAISSLIVRMIGLIYRIPLARIIGDDAYGYYSTAFEFYSLALLLSSYSLPLAVSKLVSARVTAGRHKDARRVLHVSLVFGFIVGAIMSLLVYFGADVYGRFNKTPMVAIPLRVLAPTIFVFSVMGVLRGYFQGFGNMAPTAQSQIIEQIVNAIVSVGAAMFMVKKYAGFNDRDAYGAAGGTWGTFLGACAAALTLAIIFLVTKQRYLQPVLEDKVKDRERYMTILKILLMTALPVVISQTVYQLSGTIDVTVFNRTLNGKGIIEETRNTWWGIYSGKYKLLTNVPVAIASAMGTAVVPSLVAEVARRRMDVVKEKISTVIKFNMIIAFPCAFGFISIGGPILRMLYGDGRELSALMMQIGGIAVVFFALSTVSNGILQGINHMFLPVWHSLLALIIHCVALGALLHFTEMNAIALVLCNVLFALIVCVLNARSIRKLLGYEQEWKTTFIIPLVSAAVMGAFANMCYGFIDWIAGNVMPGHPGIVNLIACIVSIGLAAFVYFAVLILLKGISRKEIEEMPKGRVLANILCKLRLLREETEN